MYDVNDVLLYTLTGELKSLVDTVIAQLPVDIATIYDMNVAGYLTAANMSLSVFTGENVDYV